MGSVFARIANRTAALAGHYLTFLLAVALIVGWAASGPFFGFSDTWQLVINTGTTIATFLMVFLIQNTQNRDAMATHVKLDEIIRAIAEADDELMRAEDQTEDELRALKRTYGQLARDHAALRAAHADLAAHHADLAAGHAALLARAAEAPAGG